MSSPVSDRPPRQTTTEPFARLRPQSDASQTGPRPVNVKANARPDEEEAPLAAIPAEKLRKPYASLIPGATSVLPGALPPSQTPPARAPGHFSVPSAARTATPTTPPIGWDDSSSLTQSGNSRPSKAVCPKHKIAKNPQGICMLCARNSKAPSATDSGSSAGSNWKGPVLAMVAATLVGVALAALL